MLRRFNSLSIRLILIAILSTGLVVALATVGWRAISRLLAINESIAEAEDQENRLLTIQTLSYQVLANPESSPALLSQIRLLRGDFDQAQRALYQQYTTQQSDAAIAQVTATMHDTDTRWAATEDLLAAFATTPDRTRQAELLPDIEASITITNVYANRTSEAFAAVAERERRNVLWTAAIVGVLTLASTGLILSLLVDVLHEMRGLTNIAHAFSIGDYSLRASTSGLNEIATVGQTFNQMAASIQQREAALRGSNVTLELRVHERTVELETAMMAAEEASRLKSEFLANMSHELRTPLNAIILFTESMMAGMLGEINDRQLDKLTRVQVNSKRLLGLINDLLDIARIEAGRIEVVNEPFSVRDLALTLKAQTESLAEKNGLDYRLHIDPALPALLIGDAPRIEQIAKNLISNACKFTKQGSVDLYFRASGADTWEIAVTDTGVGIPPHALDFIFDEFRQVDGSSQRAFGGTGLGLAISRNLARIMDGNIRVISTLGEGSTFTVTLPLMTPESEPAKEITHA
jgi:signal transduction histidine kinase